MQNPNKKIMSARKKRGLGRSASLRAPYLGVSFTEDNRGIKS